MLRKKQEKAKAREEKLRLKERKAKCNEKRNPLQNIDLNIQSEEPLNLSSKV